MTNLLQQAFEKASQLSEEDQERIALLLLNELKADEHWDDLLSSPESQSLLEEMATRALAEHRAGRTRPLKIEDL